MNAFEAEDFRQFVLDLLSRSTSPKQRLYLLKGYYNNILNTSSDIIADAFIIEFIDDFLECADKFEVFYSHPQITDDLLGILKRLKGHPAAVHLAGKIDSVISILSRKLLELNALLEGKQLENYKIRKMHLPFLEKDSSQSDVLRLGTLETITVSIKKNNLKNTITIVPTPDLNDAGLTEQVYKSWETAIDFIRKHGGKISSYHTIIIQFDNQLANYIGISLGAALTLSIIEELITFYNFPIKISIKENIAITGGFDNSGNLIVLDESLVLNKLEIVFYSFINIFIVPEENKAIIETYLKALKKQYPSRDLEIIGIKNLQDLLNRRNLIDIKRFSVIKRAAKFAKKNWVISILLLIIMLISGYFYEYNFDDNPAMLDLSGDNLMIENSSGKILWSKEIEIDPVFASSTLRYIAKIIDVNKDKKNEVILCHILQSELNNEMEYGGIFCYNYLGTQLWHYDFTDTVKSYGENLDINYSCELIDTVTYLGKQLLIARANNGPSFSSSIFTLDLNSGKRIGTTFWNPGHIDEGIMKVMPGDKSLIVFAGGNNGYEKPFIGGIELKNLLGYAPSTHYYTYLNMKPADLAFYILIPKTDYLKHFAFSLRTGGIEPGSLRNTEREKKIYFVTCERKSNEASLEYRLSYNFKDISIVVLSNFRVERDTAVAHGILSPPLTDTPEFCKLLENQILYWNGKKFVKKNELKN